MERSRGFLESKEFARLQAAVTERLVARRDPGGHWTGRLSSSALSTATAMAALRLVSGQTHAGRLAAGGSWLVATQLPDGSWGDTVSSRGNLSTTLLCWSVLAALGEHEDFRADVAGGTAAAGRAAAWIEPRTGGLGSERIGQALARIYGRDRTFSVPILTHATLCGRFGDPRMPATWRCVPQLPFELAALPRALFQAVDMQVVSYALPALIAIGQVRHALAPVPTPLAVVRNAARKRTLDVLAAIQPEDGGFLEATPLTSFVTMSLAGMGLGDHPVARRGAAFLTASQRPDGSWPIDTNLATWVTTLAVTALAAGGGLAEHLGASDREAIRRWLLDQQWRSIHPATGAAAGGWAWTDLPGGVPDADDTSGAVSALACLEAAEGRLPRDDVRRAAVAGMAWLANLANRDGGIPTFCRGWGRLPFDTSCPDITAHALRAVDQWRVLDPSAVSAASVSRMCRDARRYLAMTQAEDGSWCPLWFGNEHHPAQANPTYGTSRVVLATGDERGAAWLLEALDADGGAGGGPGLPASIEETAATVEALARVAAGARTPAAGSRALAAVERGLEWLSEQTEAGTRFPPAPIGLYFAKLWYDEELYPLVFTVAACQRARALARGRTAAGKLPD